MDVDARPEADLPHVPLVVEEQPRTRDGRPARATPADGQVSPLRALAGAGIAVAGVALGIGALLTVTSGGDDGQGPVVAAAQSEAAEPSEAPLVTAPLLEAAAPLPGDDVPATLPAASAAPVAPGRTTARTAARAAAVRPPVTVLNNSTRTGLADRAAARFTRAGWPVRGTGNFRGKLRATTVYYEPGQRAAAQRFAASFRGITRVLPRPSNIPGPRGLVVVLTRSFAA